MFPRFNALPQTRAVTVTARSRLCVVSPRSVCAGHHDGAQRAAARPANSDQAHAMATIQAVGADRSPGTLRAAGPHQVGRSRSTCPATVGAGPASFSVTTKPIPRSASAAAPRSGVAEPQRRADLRGRGGPRRPRARRRRTGRRWRRSPSEVAAERVEHLVAVVPRRLPVAAQRQHQHVAAAPSARACSRTARAAGVVGRVVRRGAGARDTPKAASGISATGASSSASTGPGRAAVRQADAAAPRRRSRRPRRAQQWRTSDEQPGAVAEQPRARARGRPARPSASGASQVSTAQTPADGPAPARRRARRGARPRPSQRRTPSDEQRHDEHDRQPRRARPVREAGTTSLFQIPPRRQRRERRRAASPRPAARTLAPARSVTALAGVQQPGHHPGRVAGQDSQRRQASLRALERRGKGDQRPRPSRARRWRSGCPAAPATTAAAAAARWRASPLGGVDHPGQRGVRRRAPASARSRAARPRTGSTRRATPPRAAPSSDGRSVSRARPGTREDEHRRAAPASAAASRAPARRGRPRPRRTARRAGSPLPRPRKSERRARSGTQTMS